MPFILVHHPSPSQAERDVNILSIPVPIRRGGSESNLDVVDSVGDDGVGLDFTKGALGIDSLQQKILKVGPTDTSIKSKIQLLLFLNELHGVDKNYTSGFKRWLLICLINRLS